MTTQPSASSSTPSLLDEHFARLEQASEADRYEDRVLWPNTPVSDLQPQIAKVQGVPDVLSGHSHSRPSLVGLALTSLWTRGELMPNRAILDICCGDAMVIGTLAERWPALRFYGVDALRFSTYPQFQRRGVAFYKLYLQRLLSQDLPERVDVAIMLNTYRGWHSAQLRPHEADMERQAREWFRRNAKHLILTVRQEQLADFPDYHEWPIGPGEENSRMVLLSPKE